MHHSPWRTRRARTFRLGHAVDPQNWFGTTFDHRGSVGNSVVGLPLLFHRPLFQRQFSSHCSRSCRLPPGMSQDKEGKDSGTSAVTSSGSGTSALRQGRLGQTTVEPCPPEVGNTRPQRIIDEKVEIQAVTGRPGQTFNRCRLEEPDEKEKKKTGAQELHRNQAQDFHRSNRQATATPEL